MRKRVAVDKLGVGRVDSDIIDSSLTNEPAVGVGVGLRLGLVSPGLAFPPAPPLRKRKA